MLSHYFNVLKELFVTFPWLSLFVVILFILVTCVMLIGLIILILDDLYDVYRPKLYPYSLLFDRIIPLTFLCLPSIIGLCLFKFVEKISILDICVFVIGIHIFLVIPIFHYWAKLRFWSYPEADILYFIRISNNPILYKYLSVGIIYPFIWIGFFSLARYLRLGTSLYIGHIFSSAYLDFFIFGLFLLPFHTNIWYKMVLWSLLDLRLYLFDIYVNLVYSIHIYLLRYNIYYFLFKNFQRVTFIIITYIINETNLYPKATNSVFRNVLAKVWFRMKYLFILGFIVSLIEAILYEGYIYYGLFIFFIAPILYNLTRFLGQVYLMHIGDDCCYSDYITRNWKNPRYPFDFAIFLGGECRGQFQNLTEEEEKIIIALIEKYEHKIYHIRHITDHTKNKPYCFRLKATYKDHKGIRWMHTAVAKIFHPWTTWILHGAHRFFLINDNWLHYSATLRAEKQGYITKGFKDSHLYKNFTGDSRNFQETVEFNLQTNFFRLKQEGVILSRYDKNIHMDTKQQPEPDMLADFSKSSFLDKRTHGLDQKSGTGHLGSSIIYSDIQITHYSKKLKSFEGKLFFDYAPNRINKVDFMLNPSAVSEAIHKLTESCDNLDAHQLIWASTLHLFPKEYIPPLRVPQNFCLKDAKPEFLEAIEKSKLTVIKVSEYLYMKYPKASPYDLPPESLFEDTYLQRILREN